MKRYDNLDGLRTFAAIGIILMHVMANANYQLPQNAVFNIIGKSGLLVELFFMISAFGMCCGYYERVKNGKISLDGFYKKRYLKILPFFALLTCIDVAMSGGDIGSMAEGFSNITLMYGLFPNADISVIGVGWALGVIFAFYMLFPYFVFMLWNKKRGWFFLALTMIINFVCDNYFGGYACNIARWLCYFVAGGLIYLHRDTIESIIGGHKSIALTAVAVISAACYITPAEIGGVSIAAVKLIILFAAWMCYAVSVKSVVLFNPFTKFMNEISFEIYLSHMMVFRALEKAKLLNLAGNGILSYAVSCLAVIAGSAVFSVIAKKIINKLIHIIRGINYDRKKA